MEYAPIALAVIAAVAAIVGPILVYRRSKGDSKQKLNEYIDNRVAEQLKGALAELDLAKAKLGASARVFRAVARQAPADFHPLLPREDVELLEDTLPPQWVGIPNI